MRVLFSVWECAPFIKVGGLGDVARSLPLALHDLGTDIRIILPFYKSISVSKRISLGTIYVVYDGKKHAVDIYETRFPDREIPVYLLRNRRYFHVPVEDTFSVYDLTVVEFLKQNISGWTPDIIHTNDNHCGLIPHLVVQEKLPQKTLFTIHNIYFQRKRSIHEFKKMRLTDCGCRFIEWETEKRKMNFLLEGINHADMVNTVSPTYATEILTEEYGAGLDDILQSQAKKITGILNGIDYSIRNPQNDPYIPYHYCASTISGSKYKLFAPDKGKLKNKKYLQRELGFQVQEDIPLIGFVGRFESAQKGVDLIHKMLLRMDDSNFQFIMLGKGDVAWEERFEWITTFRPKNIYVNNLYTDEMASKIYAACDFLMIPSKFEPCGLIQMIAMKYGCLPIAHSTGGLKDTIEDGEDGFLFEKPTSVALESAIRRAVKVRRDFYGRFLTMRKRAMEKDFSWNRSAVKYMSVYSRLLSGID